MVYRGASPTVLVALLAAAVFLVRTAALMLGPLLVTLAAAFHTRDGAVGCRHQHFLGDHGPPRRPGLRYV